MTTWSNLSWRHQKALTGFLNRRYPGLSEREAFRKWAADEERRAKIAEARDEASSDPRAQQRAMLRRIKCELAELNGTVQAPRERAVVRHIEADRVTWGAGEY